MATQHGRQWEPSRLRGARADFAGRLSRRVAALCELVTGLDHEPDSLARRKVLSTRIETLAQAAAALGFERVRGVLDQAREQLAGLGVADAASPRDVEHLHKTLSRVPALGWGAPVTLPGNPGALNDAPWWPEERSSKPRRRRDVEHHQRVSLARRRAVVVDDDPAIVWFLAALLGSAGVEVLEAHDGQRALDLTFEAWPDFVVSDVLMPGVDGMALCHQIKRDVAVRDVPVMLLSWKEDLLQHVRDLGVEADAFLTKDARGSAVLSRVREVLWPRARFEDRLDLGGEVRGRLDGFTPRLLLELVSTRMHHAHLGVRTGSFLYEIQIRDGRLRSVTRSSKGGSYARGHQALARLLGVSAGRFTVAPTSTPCAQEFEGPLAEVLAPHVAAARGALKALGAASLPQIERVTLDEAAVSAELDGLPTPFVELLKRVQAGASPRELCAAGATRPLGAALANMARRGAVLAICGPHGEDLLGPSPVPSTPEDAVLPAIEQPTFTFHLTPAAEASEEPASPPSVEEQLCIVIPWETEADETSLALANSEPPPLDAPRPPQCWVRAASVEARENAAELDRTLRLGSGSWAVLPTETPERCPDAGASMPAPLAKAATEAVGIDLGDEEGESELIWELVSADISEYGSPLPEPSLVEALPGEALEAERVEDVAPGTSEPQATAAEAVSLARGDEEGESELIWELVSADISEYGSPLPEHAIARQEEACAPLLLHAGAPCVVDAPPGTTMFTLLMGDAEAPARATESNPTIWELDSSELSEWRSAAPEYRNAELIGSATVSEPEGPTAETPSPSEAESEHAGLMAPSLAVVDPLVIDEDRSIWMSDPVEASLTPPKVVAGPDEGSAELIPMVPTQPGPEAILVIADPVEYDGEALHSLFASPPSPQPTTSPSTMPAIDPLPVRKITFPQRSTARPSAPSSETECALEPRELPAQAMEPPSSASPGLERVSPNGRSLVQRIRENRYVSAAGAPAATILTALLCFGVVRWWVAPKSDHSQPRAASSEDAPGASALSLASSPALKAKPAEPPKVEDLTLPPNVSLPSGKALLEVATTDRQAIYVDEAFVGLGPVRPVVLDPGSHDVRVRFEGAERSYPVVVAAMRLARLNLAGR